MPCMGQTCSSLAGFHDPSNAAPEWQARSIWVTQQRVKGGLSTQGACWMGSLELVKDVLPVILQEGRIDRSNTWGSHSSPL
jgi:hypothetical protein